MVEIIELVQFGGVGLAFFAIYVLYDIMKTKKKNGNGNGNGNENGNFDFKLCFDAMVCKLDDVKKSIDKLANSVDAWGYREELENERMKNILAKDQQELCERIDGLSADIEKSQNE